ncbi:MAG: response regulator [Acidobacteriota bacterium]|nr:response regulator [Acidobacteriota bacterium]
MARVLVAEDDAEVRALIGAVLRKSGHHIEFAADGQEAMDCLSGEPYDIILLDLMMPKASGFEVLAWMHREKRGLAKRSVIVLTAMAEKDLVHLTQERVFAVIRKPFDISMLVAKIAESLAAAAPR